MGVFFLFFPLRRTKNLSPIFIYSAGRTKNPPILLFPTPLRPSFIRSSQLFWSVDLSRTCLAWRGFTETNRRRSIGQQSGSKSGFRPADKPRVNRTFCSSICVHMISFVHASGETFGTVSFLRRPGVQEVRLFPGRTGPSASCSAPPAPPRRPAVHRPAPTRPWYVRVWDSTGQSDFPLRRSVRISRSALYSGRQGRAWIRYLFSNN